MNQEFNTNLLEYLKNHNEINFEIVFVTKGYNFNSSLSKENELSENIEEWIGSKLVDFLVDCEIYYNFKGKFIYEENEIEIYLTFIGPYEEKYEPNKYGYLSFNEFNLPSPIKNKILNIVEEIDEESFEFHFLIENDKFSHFRFNYDHDYKTILCEKDLNQDELVIFKNEIQKEINSSDVDQVLDISVDDKKQVERRVIGGDTKLYFVKVDSSYIKCDAGCMFESFRSETYKIKMADVVNC